MTIRLLALGVLLAAAPAAAQVPNEQGALEQVAVQYPQQFACAHTGAGCSWDWIKLAACTLHAREPRWGLNGKRGNPNDLSMDVVAWRGAGTAVDVVNGGAMEIIDVIGGAGGPNPRIVWGVGPGGPGDRGAWVDPTPFCGTGVGGGNSGGNTGGGTGGGGASVNLQPLVDKLNELIAHQAALTGTVNGLRDAVAAMQGDASTAAYEATNAATRASEIKTALEVLPSRVLFPVYRASTPFGGVTLRPQQ